jgi:RecA/RadA recombinase
VCACAATVQHTQTHTHTHACLCQVDFVAVDSVSALLPRAELEGAMGELQVCSRRCDAV